MILVALFGCANRQPQPDVWTDPAWVYHECPKCESLDGGCYMKNSVSSYRSDKGKRCRHDWKRITKEEFDQKWKKRAGTEDHY